MAEPNNGQDPVGPESTPGQQADPSQNNPDPQGDPADPQDQNPQESPGEQRRVQSLANKVRETAQERDTYREELERYRSSNRQQPAQRPGSVDQLEDDLNNRGATEYERGRNEVLSDVDQRFFLADLERDSEYLAGRHDQLDENSDEYNPALVESVNRQFARAIGFNEKTGEISNPKIRYRDFVEDYLGDLERHSAGRDADTARNVATQASRTGVRPNSPSRRSGMGPLNPGDISKMTYKDYEKNKDVINSEILRNLGV